MVQSNYHSKQNQIRIIIIDDRKLVYEMLRIYIETATDLTIVGYADNGKTGLELIKQFEPHIAIVDLEMPDLNGIATISIIQEHFPYTKVLVLSGHDEPEYINQAIKAGAKGYVLKGTSAEGLTDAIRYVSKGYFHLGSNLFKKLVFGSLSESSLETKKDLENKLVLPLQHFKWEITDQCHSLIDQGLENTYQQLTEVIELKLHALKHQQLNNVSTLKRLQRRIYLLSLTQVFLFFIIVSYMMMDR